MRGDGVVADYSVSSEGSYTVAYPMAVLGVSRSDRRLTAEALRQLRLRRDRLNREGALYLRHGPGGMSFRNWTRGICWYFLGLTRSLEALGADADPLLAAHVAEFGSWTVDRQRPDGMWDNFLDEHGRPPDASGSAGIAAALALAHRLGLGRPEFSDAAMRCWDRLGDYLEPDGMLGCVAPNNKRGELEQHASRRTIEPFALGLYGQLAAACRSG